MTILTNHPWLGFFLPFCVIIIAGVFDFLWFMYSSGQKKREPILKPCPKFGHKAIIVWYNGENNPQFYLPECGAYTRRDTNSCEVQPDGYFDKLPPMTEIQKKCKYLAGYCNQENIPQFITPRAAAVWWNKNYDKIMKQKEKQVQQS